MAPRKPAQAFALLIAISDVAAFRFSPSTATYAPLSRSAAFMGSAPIAQRADPFSNVAGARLQVCLQTRGPTLGVRTFGAGFRRRGVFLSTLSAAAGGKQKVVFLGTPEVAAQSLRALIAASQAPDAPFEIAAVISNPPAKQGRNKQLQSSPVHLAGEEAGIPVLTPAGLLKKHEGSAEFLEQMSTIAPDLCITAAYGQFLPKAFLSIPRLGTLNIHPSLLPKFRGASPVPRALEEGVDVTGVSVLFTVFEMDAGPIVACRELRLDGSEKKDVSVFEMDAGPIVACRELRLDGSEKVNPTP
ncbi:formyl transferase [Baffinella frigidus]|nr:formyl transferase [Cryptophyta sp. CCMP2293]